VLVKYFKKKNNMEINFNHFNNWVISSSFEVVITFKDPAPIEGESEQISDHQNTILNITSPSGSGYGDTHYNRIDVTDEIIAAYSSSL
jgi:hypothetical protein